MTKVFAPNSAILCILSRHGDFQTWTNNMSKTTSPAIKDSFDDYTKITFSPDLAKFKMDKLDKDTVALLSRRAYDIAASTRGVKVFLNDKRVPVSNLTLKLFEQKNECLWRTLSKGELSRELLDFKISSRG